MNTTLLLMAIHEKAIIPAEVVARDYFELGTAVFLRKTMLGEIPLPVCRMEESQKCAKGVHVADLAAYLDKRRASAAKEAQAMAPFQTKQAV